METSEENQPPKPKSISRRGFLRLGAAAGAVAVVATAEVVAGKEGIETPYGNFRFLYERHDVGINAKDIPSNTNILFKEISLGKSLFKQSATEIFQTGYEVYGGIIIPFLSADILTRLAQINAEIMIGDVDLEDPVGKGIKAVEFSAGVYALWKILGRKSEVRTPTPGEAESIKSQYPRRKFLKTVATIGAIWAMSPVISLALKLLGTNTSEQTAFKRISSRLEGIQSHFHPESAIIFFRDAMMADKLLAVGEEYIRTQRAKPNFAVFLEGGHSGVEDLIRVGPVITRTIVLSWPLGILKDIIRNNNGVVDFSSARIFKLPNNLTHEDVLNGTKWSMITGRRVTDYVLVEELQRKLSTTSNTTGSLDQSKRP